METAVSGLLHLDSLPLGAQQDLLLTALSVAGSGLAAPLADGVLRLFERQVQLHSDSKQATPLAWRSHLLSRVLLSNAAAANSLVLGVTRMLASAAQASAFERVLTALRPFLSFVLLDPQLRTQLPLLPLQLQGALARLACSTGSTTAQRHLLALLVAHLPALHLATASGGDLAQQAAAACAAVAEVLDVVESCHEEPGALHPTAASLKLLMCASVSSSHASQCCSCQVGFNRDACLLGPP